MPHVTGEERNQIIMLSLESSVPHDAFVRVIDAFVDATDLDSFGFAHITCKDEGRPAFHPAVLLKLYLYGYRYGVRSSRKLEREAHLNLEAMWLTSCQNPKYKTIADFRKNHGKAFRQVFRSFVLLLKEWGLADGKTIAIDSFKIRAQNSLKNNLNQQKIDRHLEYIDNKVSEYEKMLDQADREEDHQELEEKIKQQQIHKEAYQAVEKQLQESGQDQISLTDPDARSVVLHRNIVNVGYNVQASVDAKNKLMVEYDTGDVNDSHALVKMATATKELLKPDTMDVLADKGYHTGEELKKCEGENIVTYVSPKASAAKDTGVFPVADFIYDPKEDCYSCPAGEKLTTNKVWYNHSGKEKTPAFRFQRYTTFACKNCLLRNKCTKGKANGRAIDRSEYADFIARNNERVKANPNYYRQRQQIAEHPFGTLKRQRGFTFTLMKGKEKVIGEVGLEFIGYNLGRCATIMGIPELVKALKAGCFDVFVTVSGLFLSLLGHLFSNTDENQSSGLLKLLPAHWPENENKKLYLTTQFYQRSFCTDSRYGTSGSYNWYEGGKSRSGVASNWSDNMNLDFAKRKEISAGFEGLFLNKFLGVEVNYFHDIYSGLVVRPTAAYPSFYADFVPYENFEEDQYHGVELGIRLSKNWGDWSFYTGMNMLYSSSERTKVNEIYSNDYQYRKGHPKDATFGLESLGFFQSQEEIDASPRQMFGIVRPGDLKYKDQNGDNVIDANDEVFLRRWQAPWSGGLEIRLSYKNLTLFLLGEGQMGAKNFRENSYYWIDGTDKYSEIVLESWTEVTKNTAKYPRISSQSNSNNLQRSSFWLYKNDYFNLRRVQLNYSMPQSISNALAMKDLIISLNASDLYQFTKNRKERELRVGGEPNYSVYTLTLKANF